MLIQFKNVIAKRDEQLVLNDLNLSLAERRIGVIGPNGSGKSSLIRLINGLLMPLSGQVLVDGLDTRDHAMVIRRQVGFVFQNPDNQIIFPVVHEDIEFGLEQRLADKTQRVLRARATLEQLQISHLFDRVTHSLSGGERQLVALAAVLATEPAMLVFDEPTTQLDLRMRNQFERILCDLPQSAIVVSHDLALMQTMDRVLVLSDGRVVFDGEPASAILWYTEHYA
jgi:biotin transport system ATP-binding protein